MPKQILSIILFVLFVMGIVMLVVTRSEKTQNKTIVMGNTSHQAMEIESGNYQCAKCGMGMNNSHDAAQAVADDGRTWFYDDVGCLAIWINQIDESESFTVWVFARDTQSWINGRTAWYSRTDETPMRFGFAAYSKRKSDHIDYAEMLELISQGKSLKDPETRELLLGNN
jgi:copper chaperone NosL